MTEEILFDQLSFARKLTLLTFDSISEDTADKMPEGFNNSLRWHLGHIYLTQEWLAFYYGNEQAQVPLAFDKLFSPGTKPADWTTAPPTLDELRSLLSEQTSRIRQTFAGRLHESTKKPFTVGPDMELNTIGAMLLFTLHHEGHHFGFIKALQRAIQQA